MSWFFGKKKVKDSPPDSGEEASSSTSNADDYILVERQTNLPPSIAGGPGNDPSIKPFGLYPHLQDQPMNPPAIPSNLSQMDVLCDMTRYLQCVKFQLNKKFENDIEIDRLHADEILSFILKVKSDDYDYDFSLENSVINEMC